MSVEEKETPIAFTQSEQTVVDTLPTKEDPDAVGGKGEEKQPLHTRVLKAVSTREGWFGDYDYAWLCTPQLPFLSKRGEPPFYGVNDKIPIFMAAVLGLQHALAMLGGLITPPIVLGGAGDGHLNLDADYKNYMISAALISCGILTIFSITALPLPGNRQLGTGLISVLGTSFAFVPVAEAGFKQMYSSGFCKTIIGADGTSVPQPCPEAWGAFLGTCMLCCWIEIALSQLPAKTIKKVFPPLVSGIVLTLVGVELTGTGMKYWAGGSGPCLSRPATGFFSKCPNIAAPNAVPWGHANWIGLGFSVWVTIVLIEVIGSPFMKSASVVIGLAVGYIIAAATGYISTSGMNSAPAVTFLWVKTFPISINGPLVIPCLFVFIVLTLENIGDVTATCDVSNVEVEGPVFEKRIRGGLLADGIAAFISTLFTNAPVTTFAQNNGVIALTKCANRQAGYWCCFWLILAGVFSKFAAFITAMPDAVLGGMTSFLFCNVAVSGIRILAYCKWTRRQRFIASCSFCIGLGVIIVPSWFTHFFTYAGDNAALKGFLDAISIVVSTGYCISGFIAIFLNLVLPETDESTEIQSRVHAH
ncbi:putative purine permease [Gonapodya prolifera JEL478]|uniref:Putative purine permease n=1 Tax=Gonapodya prolifera (strain JEL478) TaxID=1344416 RepID=A0A139A8D5_GONPJ|nr:putative purine permease [Gonapodya prolifera JEL478]|eukprot:KXS12959.1 putative purine permease [Gonapodya prolifera JEL478]